MKQLLLYGVLLIFLPFLVDAGNGGRQSIPREILNECKQETGFEGSFRELKKNVTEAGKCYLNCCLTKTGMLKGDGTLDTAKIKSYMENYVQNTNVSNVLMKIVEECSKEESPLKDMCEAAFKYFECKKKKKNEK